MGKKWACELCGDCFNSKVLLVEHLEEELDNIKTEFNDAKLLVYEAPDCIRVLKKQLKTL